MIKSHIILTQLPNPVVAMLKSIGVIIKFVLADKLQLLCH